MIKHLVQCGRCQKEVEAKYLHSAPGRFIAPDNWLTINYDVINTGQYTTLEERHACPECTPGIMKALEGAFPVHAPKASPTSEQTASVHQA